MAITRPRVSTCSEFRLSPYRLRTRQRSDAATCCEPANSTKSFEVDLDILPRQGPSTSYPIGYGLDFNVGIQRGSRWTVGVQRLLQPTRELVRSRYETRVKSQGVVITR